MPRFQVLPNDLLLAFAAAADSGEEMLSEQTIARVDPTGWTVIIDIDPRPPHGTYAAVAIDEAGSDQAIETTIWLTEAQHKQARGPFYESDPRVARRVVPGAPLPFDKEYGIDLVTAGARMHETTQALRRVVASDEPVTAAELLAAVSGALAWRLFDQPLQGLLERVERELGPAPDGSEGDELAERRRAELAAALEAHP